MATENALMAAALTPGSTVIHNAASEPHVQDLARLLLQMGARIEGIGSNVLIIHGRDQLGGADYRIGPDYIEIGSFVALAAVTGGELRICDTVPEDLRMTRLAFERLGCTMEFDGNDVVVPPEQRLRVRDDEGDAISKVEDGPWPAFPADLTSIALALATQSEGMVLIFEKMFENRLFFVDKLVSMGARVLLCDPHRAVVSGPSRLHGERMESPDIRAGMAMLIAALCADGPIGDRQHPPDRPRLRAHRRAAPGARRAHRARSSRTACRLGHLPSGGQRDPPRTSRHARRAARRDARAPRAHPAHARRLRARRIRRGVDAGARVRGRAAAGRGARRRRLPALRRPRPRAGPPLGRDDPDRPAGGQPLRRRGRAAAPVLLRPRLPRRPARQRAGARVPAGRRRADRRRRRRGRCRGDRRDRRGAVGSGPAPPPRRAWRRHALPRAAGRHGGARGRAPAAARGALAPRPGEPGVADRRAGACARGARSAGHAAHAAGRAGGAGPGGRVTGRRGRQPARVPPAAVRARRGRSRDLRPGAPARPGLLHRHDLRGLRPGRLVPAGRRRPLRRAAGALRRGPPGVRRGARRAARARGADRGGAGS